MNPKLHLFRNIALWAGLITVAACTGASGSSSAFVESAIPCPKSAAPCNMIRGYPGNSAGSGVTGATISGGGVQGLPNQVSGNQGTVGGGDGNLAGEGSTVAGGIGNIALHFHASVSGGTNNLADAEEATIGGGLNNTASGPSATVGGGAQNLASASFTSIGGGAGNEANYIFATVGGGTFNQASNEAGVVSGGNYNRAQGSYSSILGGINNTAVGSGAAIGGGAGNTATGSYTTIPGGFANSAAGDYSFAAGRGANVNAENPGSFLFADSNIFQFPSIAPNEFAVRATGGVRFITAIDSSGAALAGVRISPGSGAWENLSDAQAKAGFASVNERQVLDRLMSLPISTWSYRGQDPSVRHIGPMAQDFYSAFQVGDDTHYISTVDEEGVALAAIQELARLVQQVQVQSITTSPSEDSALSRQVTSLERQLTYSNGLAAAALLTAILALWRPKRTTPRSTPRRHL